MTYNTQEKLRRFYSVWIQAYKTLTLPLIENRSSKTIYN
jgi:hypothetical protein